MDVLTLQPATANPEVANAPLISHSIAVVNAQCVNSDDSHRPQCALISTEFVSLKPPATDIDANRKPAGIPRPVVSMENLTCSKRAPVEQLRIARPLKKARLIVVAAAPAAVRRTVHFEELQGESVVGEKSATIKTHIRIYERIEACDVANIWWSGEEMWEIMNREKSAISVMSYCCGHYTSEVLNLMRMARDRSSIPGMATTESSSPLWVASSPVRGLERDIVQGFKQRKRQVIRKVLESQRVLKTGRHHETGEQTPLELQSQLLSTQYKKWSHPMVRFAQVLAEGDAQVVIDSDPATAPTLEAF